MTAAGALLAELHECAALSTIAEPIPAELHGNRAVYFHRENRLLDYRTDRDMLIDAIDRVQAVLDELWRSRPHPPHLLARRLRTVQPIALAGPAASRRVANWMRDK